MERKIRVLVGKPGLDGHDRGARVIAAALRDAGMEVVYTGLRASVPAIAAAAAQEDVKALTKLKADIPIVVGGIIPAADHESLRALGVAAVFGPESPLGAVVETVRALASGQPAPQDPKPAPAGIPATRLDHTAICVKDMKASIALIEDILGQKVAHEEHVPAQKVDAAFFDFPNGASLELVAPRGNAGLEKFLEKRGDALHHLAMRVKDIDAVLKRLDARGVPLIDKVGRPGARGHRVAFLHPKAFGGTLLELVEAHEESSR